MSRFDAVVSALNKFEDLRYPDAVLEKGMLSGFELKKGTPAKVTGLAARVPRYTLCLEGIDELMSAVFKVADINPQFFTGRLRGDGKRYLSEENVWSAV